MIVHVLIPARSGSKSIPNKNIREYRGYPLLTHSIRVALSVKRVSRVVVSTDAPYIQTLAQEHGAEAPFLRPVDISGDESTDLECFSHYLSWLRENKQEVPDVIVHLRPTYPERTSRLLESCLDLFLKHLETHDSLRTVISVDKPPVKMYTVEDNVLCPLFSRWRDMDEPYNQVRQKFPPFYWHNGCVDIVKRETIEEKKSMSGTTIYPFIMEERCDLDIDTEDDWNRSLHRGC